MKKTNDKELEHLFPLPGKCLLRLERGRDRKVKRPIDCFGQVIRACYKCHHYHYIT
jgi:hypothetical protein